MLPISLSVARQRNLSGPVWSDGAEPGDTLQVDVLDLRHGQWGLQASGQRPR